MPEQLSDPWICKACGLKLTTAPLKCPACELAYIPNYEDCLREIVQDARRFTDAASQIAYEVRSDIQNNEDSSREEKFAETLFKRATTSLATLQIAHGMILLTGLGRFEEKIMDSLISRVLGHTPEDKEGK